MMDRIARGVVVALLVTACSLPPPDSPVIIPTSDRAPVSEVDLPEDVLLLRAWSGPWEDPDERLGQVRAAVVVYRDGLVVADVSPVADRQEFRAAQLDKAELIALEAHLATLHPSPFDHASSRNSGCMDCGVQVIRVRIGDRAVEMSVYALATEINVVPEGTPRSVVELSELLDQLGAMVPHRPAVPFARPIPIIPAAPQVGG
jgi:hypothetical protein